jgi:adenosylcobinamide amidohydrolase
MDRPALERTTHLDPVDGSGGPLLVWRFPQPVLTLATTVLGGGLGLRGWALNAEVPIEYHRDPAEHVAAIAAEHSLTGDGVGMVTAARVLEVTSADDGGATCDATVGVSTPTWAAAEDGAWSSPAPGTINLLCWVPAPLSGAALANALATATEAKAQALLEAGVQGTGTASDAVAVCCPPGGTETYGGPRSAWGARLARAVHRAVADGTRQYLGRHA